MDDQSIGNQLTHLASKVIGLITLIVFLLILIVVGLIAFYGYLLSQPGNVSTDAAVQIKDLILNLWGQITPYVLQLARVVAPIFVLIFAIGLLHLLSKSGATPFDTSKLFSDLPSTLALLIIATICLLPLAGLAVPDVLNNIALVVVGFYFGKREVEGRA